ncbi:MAG: tRNA lysidine(34) synthetase TilS, partial [Thermoanaerobaculia bacterium]
LRSRARGERRSGVSAAAQVFELPAGATPEFIVRPRRPGDRFQPLGLDVPKRLKDLLIDRRIAAELRDHLPLLVWNDEIVWVPGVEVSERFKVSSPAGVFYEVRMEVSGAGDDDNHAHVHR